MSSEVLDLETKYKIFQGIILSLILGVPVQDHVGHCQGGGPADPHLAVDQHLAAS